MTHDLTLIATLATALVAALLLGLVALRLRLPALVGYLLAGVAIGPHTPGFIADPAMAAQLAEIGVMLLMFGVGLHFSWHDLLAVRKIAVPGALLQITVATLLGAGVALGWGWDGCAALVFGLALSVASTVVLLRALEARGLVDSINGRIAVGWLVVEDLATVLALVLLPAVAGALDAENPQTPAELGIALALTALQIAGFIALMLIVGRRVLPRLLWQVSASGSRELFTLAVTAAALGIAYGAAKLFEVSFALGAFFAGVVLRESEFSQRAARQSLPLREAFAVLFFVSVGMLFDPAVLTQQPLQVLAVAAIIMLGKTLAAAVLVLLLRHPLNTALTVAASLAQIGEFSFILAGLGVSLELLPEAGRSLILAGALISIALNPLLFALVEPFRRWIVARSPLARSLEQPADPLAALPQASDPKYSAGHVVLVGFGRVGRLLAAGLSEQGVALVVVEQSRERVLRLRAQGYAAVYGNATDASSLLQARIANARLLVVATPDTFDVRQIARTARRLNAAIEVVARSHSEEEAALLSQDGTAQVFLGEAELAAAMSRHVVGRLGEARRD